MKKKNTLLLLTLWLSIDLLAPPKQNKKTMTRDTAAASSSPKEDRDIEQVQAVPTSLVDVANEKHPVTTIPVVSATALAVVRNATVTTGSAAAQRSRGGSDDDDDVALSAAAMSSSARFQLVNDGEEDQEAFLKKKVSDILAMVPTGEREQFAQEWDLSTGEEASTSKGMPTRATRIQELLVSLWAQKVTCTYLQHRVSVFLGLKTKSETIMEVISQGELKDFFETTNEQKAGDGIRWIDEALMEVLDAGNEHATRTILQSFKTLSIPRDNLPPATLLRSRSFLIEKAKARIESLRAETEDCIENVRELSMLAHAADTRHSTERGDSPVLLGEDAIEAMAKATLEGLQAQASANKF